MQFHGQQSPPRSARQPNRLVNKIRSGYNQEQQSARRQWRRRNKRNASVNSVSGLGVDGFHFLCPFDLVGGLVDELTGQDPALQLRPQQAALSLRALHEAAVLLGTAGQVGDDFIHRAVGDVLVDRETRLTCLRRSKRLFQSGGRRTVGCNLVHFTSGTLHRVLSRNRGVQILSQGCCGG